MVFHAGRQRARRDAQDTPVPAHHPLPLPPPAESHRALGFTHGLTSSLALPTHLPVPSERHRAHGLQPELVQQRNMAVPVPPRGSTMVVSAPGWGSGAAQNCRAARRGCPHTNRGQHLYLQWMAALQQAIAQRLSGCCGQHVLLFPGTLQRGSKQVQTGMDPTGRPASSGHPW